MALLHTAVARVFETLHHGSQTQGYVDGLVQDCSISSALAMEIIQFALSHRYNTVDKTGAILVTQKIKTSTATQLTI